MNPVGPLLKITFMDPSLAESRDRLRQALDDEIKSWQESTRALRSRRNALAPISRLSPETLVAIFSYFPSSAWERDVRYFTRIKGSDGFPKFHYLPWKKPGHLAWITITHVCRQWRETALNHPGLWTCINFTNLKPAGMAELLTRAKMAPLHLEAEDTTKWSVARINTFETQLEAHISHTRHLRICGPLQSTLERLVSSAPCLESLSLSHTSGSSGQVVLPVNFFNCTAPGLTTLKLEGCNISWKSPLLKCLQTLEILRPSTEARPKLEDWLDALNEMSQLKTLTLESATPLASLAISEPSRTVTLPSLIRFNISASAKDCALAFAHLVLPALSWLRVDAESHESEGGDVQLLIPYVARNVHWLQSTEPLQNIMISGKGTRAELFAWNMPIIDKQLGTNILHGATVPARLMFGAKSNNWPGWVNTAIFDTLLTLLPLNFVSNLTAKSRTGLNKEFWLSHAPRWPLLERVCLAPPAVRGFREMLAEDTPPDGPRLPSLTKLILVDVYLTAPRTFDLRDMLMERVKKGVPLKFLDLSLCYGGNRAIQLLSEVVVDVPGPCGEQKLREEDPALFSLEGGIGSCKEVDYSDGHTWYGCMGAETESEYYEDYDYGADYSGVSSPAGVTGYEALDYI